MCYDHLGRKRSHVRLNCEKQCRWRPIDDAYARRSRAQVGTVTAIAAPIRCATMYCCKEVASSAAHRRNGIGNPDSRVADVDAGHQLHLGLTCTDSGRWSNQSGWVTEGIAGHGLAQGLTLRTCSKYYHKGRLSFCINPECQQQSYLKHKL